MTFPPLARTASRQAGILLLAAFLLAAVAAFSTHSQIQPEAVEEGVIALGAAVGRNPPPLWIDARSPAEFAQEHVPGALLLNADQWSSLLPKVLEQWEPGRASVVYCDSPGSQASREVAERLREFKLGPVFVLQGGWQAWKLK